MLRMLFGEAPRVAEGKLAEVYRELGRFVSLMTEKISSGQDPNHKLRTYEIWTLGLLASLDELEQSRYAVHGYAARITKRSVELMTEEEKLDYYRYVYFDKNAFIRIFAILDKLGTFLDDTLSLETKRIKPHFSYFTVLRGMRQRHLHPALSMVLGELKDKHKATLSNLRKRRNVEIHYMNVELIDDLQQSNAAYGKQAQLENIAGQLADLDAAFEMVAESLRLAFVYVRGKLQGNASLR